MEVTKREILFSTIILAIMIGIGVWISNPIISSLTQNALETVSAVKITDAEKFGYIKRTNAGKFYAEGPLVANDTIRLPELRRGYSYVEKVKEVYTMHTETYTTTDDKGHTQVHTRTYWSWDAKKKEKFETKTYTFLGGRFTKADIKYNVVKDKDTIIYEPKKLFHDEVRHVYYTTPITVNGILVGTADGKSYKNMCFKRGGHIVKEVERAENEISTVPVVFWIMWIILTGGLIALFYAAENHWLY